MARIAETIRKRVSVRTYDDRPLSAEDQAELEAFLAQRESPFGVPVAFRLLDAERHGLKSPVILGEHAYVAAKVARTPLGVLACGYAFEEFCLRATERGIGTVMLAASLNRKAFEKAMDVTPDEVMPVASPVGYPATKRSMRESMMRKAIKADERFPWEQLFYGESFGTALSPAGAGVFGEPLELLRLAPSAANKQPWRAVVSGDTVHFFEAHSMKARGADDIQRFDLGIALAHFDLARQEAGIQGGFTFNDQQLALPENMEYIASFKAER